MGRCVAVLGVAEGWVADYARATFRRWFQDGLEPGVAPNLTDSLREIGQDSGRVLQLAADADVGAAYEAATAEARELGIFGSPTFAVGTELFWGDDRLDDAIAWHQRGTLATVGE
jgi:2-hydroxychromene-2-carboxylate isomerase